MKKFSPYLLAAATLFAGACGNGLKSSYGKGGNTPPTGGKWTLPVFESRIETAPDGQHIYETTYTYDPRDFTSGIVRTKDGVKNEICDEYSYLADFYAYTCYVYDDSGALAQSVQHRSTFFDKEWKWRLPLIKYCRNFSADEIITASRRTEYDRNVAGRETGRRLIDNTNSLNEIILEEQKAYVYEGRNVQYDLYKSSELTHRVTMVFADDAQTLPLSRTAAPIIPGGHLSEANWEYDDQGRLIGYKEYQDRTLQLEKKDFVYRDKHLSCKQQQYRDGKVVLTTTYDITYKY